MGNCKSKATNRIIAVAPNRENEGTVPGTMRCMHSGREKSSEGMETVGGLIHVQRAWKSDSVVFVSLVQLYVYLGPPWPLSWSWWRLVLAKNDRPLYRADRCWVYN